MVLLEVLSSNSDVPLDGGDRYTEVIEEHGGLEPPSPELIAALVNRAVRRLNQGKDDAAAQDARRAVALARAAGDPAGELLALAALSLIVKAAGDAAGALAWARHAEGRLTANTPGLDKRWCTRLVATVLTDTGQLDAARRVCAAGIPLARQAGDASNLLGLLNLMANIERLAGHVPEARAHLREAAGTAARNGDHVNVMNLVNECGYLCAESGSWADAVTLWEACLADRRRRGVANVPGDESDRAGYLVRVEQALGPGQLTAARERGARMPVAAAAAMALMITAPATGETPAPPPGRLLTPRERELVTLVAQGQTNAQIARQLHISVRTVASHLDRIRDKTGQRRRADLTRLALEESLI